MKLTLPTNSEERKEVPVLSGALNYFPAALAWLARISKKGNDKHNPGEPLHHARGKSMDHGDCIIRHTMDIEDIKAIIARNPAAFASPDRDCQEIRQLLEEAAYRFWRAGAELQELCEKYDDAPLAPGARLPDPATAAAGVTCGSTHQAGAPWTCSLPPGHRGSHVAYAGHNPAKAKLAIWKR